MACCMLLKSDEVLAMEDLILALGFEIWADKCRETVRPLGESFTTYELVPCGMET